MEGEKSSILSYLEICVKDEKSMLNLLISKFGSTLSHFREHTNALQWVLQSDKSFFIVAKHLSSYHNGIESNETCLVAANGDNLSENCDPVISDSGDEYPMLSCSCVRKEHLHDTLFNVALEVKDVDSFYERFQENNTTILQKPTIIEDKFGRIRLLIVKSKCENVIHTLIDKSNYSGTFLPGFKEVNDKNLNDENLEKWFVLGKKNKLTKPLTNFIDHVTFVCRNGESKEIIEWYQICFKMKRFFTNEKDTIEDGFVINEGIDMRLKALEYWKCAETGVSTNSDVNSATTLKIVIAEPLPNVETGQIATFLEENDGPGVQHVAMNCANIVSVTNKMRNRGVLFRCSPPTTYYEQIKNLKQISKKFNISDKELCESGILIDVEEDLLDENKNKYLLQIFTHPIFKQDTFFLELIQRHGANGFGAGNITALALSIARFQEQEKLKNKEICGSK